MKIEMHEIPVRTIEEFADQHDLVLVITERKVPVGHVMRYSAHFARVEVMGDGVLASVYGNGATPDEAIHCYAQKIALTRIAVDADLPIRREIDVPRLTAPEPQG